MAVPFTGAEPPEKGIHPEDPEGSAMEANCAFNGASCVVRFSEVGLGVSGFDDASMERLAVTDETTNLDDHRGMAAQVATELRRMRAEVEADQAALRQRRDDLERLLAAPSADWAEAVEKARYLLSLFSETSAAADPRRQALVDGLLADFDRLLSNAAKAEHS